MDLAAIYVDPVTSKVSFKLQPQPITGIDKLIQVVICSLLTTAGSDVLDPTYGAGLGDIIGRYNINPDDMSEVFADMSMKIKKAEESVFSGQIGLDISSEEKLKKITLVKLTPNVDEASIDVRIRVENEVGRTKDVVL